MSKVSIIIPARNEIYLGKTIENVLANAEGDIEVLAMLDGYIPDPQLNFDNRVIFVHFPQSIGQRACVNEGARRATGKYIMKLDAHCAVDKGFDVKLQQDCEYTWTVIPRMYNLDINTWLPKRHKLTDYMYITGMSDEKPFRAMYYGGEEYKKWHKRPELIDDTMCCMGPGWFMHKDRFWELGGMDEGHGQWGQMGIEVACKAWLSGGALKVDKKTWFAHWFRGGGGPGFPYQISGNDQERARKYSQDLWLNNKWDKQVRKFQWMVDKFQPKGWSINPKLSVIIPSYKDPLLHKTIESILNNFEGSFEIIPVCDGYKPDKPIINDPRVKPIYLSDNVGMRDAINIGVKSSKGEYLMRSDEHCLFAKGFDTTILKDITDNCITTARRYFLNPEKWEVMQELGYVDYEKLLVINKNNGIKKFSGVKWIGRTKERRLYLVDETMAFQGSCWVMSRKWWDKVIGELQTEGYGSHYQDTTEMFFKTWNAGGRIMLNKNTWFAHKHRSFNRTHQYPVSKAIPEWKYALNKWMPDYERIRLKWAV